MSWASRRRFIIISILAAVTLMLIAAVVIPIVYETPSCGDQKQNQDETGIDCGGSCTKVCSTEAQSPTVQFVRHFSPSAGRTDVVAYIVNPNRSAAARNARFTIELYGADGTVVARKAGSVELPPGATVPVYMPNLYSGNLAVVRAFLLFDQSSLVFEKYDDRRVVPRYNNDAQIVGVAAPRITASFSNPSAQPVRDIPVIVTVFDGTNPGSNAIAASQTLLSELAPQGTASVTFVWNEPFPGTPARVDVIPVVPL